MVADKSAYLHQNRVLLREYLKDYAFGTDSLQFLINKI